MDKEIKTRVRTYNWRKQFVCDDGWITVEKDYVHSCQYGFNGKPEEIRQQFEDFKKRQERDLEGITKAMEKWEKEFGKDKNLIN